MKKMLVLSTVAASSLLAFNASAQDILARVVSSTPVVQQVAVPRQVCNTQQVMVESQKSGAGALLGAVAGGAAGNAIGNGNGRALATFIGLVGGAMVGDRVEGGNVPQAQNIQQCSTQTFYENRASHYNVVYEYQGTQYNTQMAQDPGPYVKLQVTPVGALPVSAAAPQVGYQQAPLQPQTPYQPVPYQPISYQQISHQTISAQPGLVVQQPVFLSPVVIQSYSTHYPRHHYRPHFQPYFQQHYIQQGASIQFNYGRGQGHWR